VPDDAADLAGPRLGIWGTFDLENFGDLVFPRVFEHEIRRRLPHAHVRLFSPLGWDHPIALDGGFGAEPLGDATPARLAELADELDLVAIGGGEIVHGRDEVYAHYYTAPADVLARLTPSRFFIEGLGAREDDTAVAWHAVGVPFDLDEATATRVRDALDRRAYVAVRDAISRERLVRAGVERPIELVPDSAFVLDRVFDRDLIERRLGHLRELDAYPAGRPLVVQGSRALVAHVEAIGREVAKEVERDPSLELVVLETGRCHGDDDFAEALAAHVPEARRLPRHVTVEDMVAAVAGSRGFVGISLHGNIAALVFGLPSAILDLAAYSKLEGLADLVGCEDRRATAPEEVSRVIAATVAGKSAAADVTPLVRSVDAHFDRLAALAETMTARRRDGAPSLAALRALRQRHEALGHAYGVRGRQLDSERLERAKAAGTDRTAAERAREVKLARRLAADAQRDAATARAELADVRAQLGRALEEARYATAARDAAFAELDRFAATRLLRYSAPLRRAYAKVRRG
jgi:lipopolysaccharide transport system ATP-binding protein